MTEPPPYPRQDLLPQQVQRSRSRLPLLLAGTAVVIVLIGGLVAWWAVQNDGDENAAEYCSALRSVFAGRGGGLGALAEGADGGPGAAVPDVIDHLRDLAPSSVRSSWDDLIDVVQSVQTSEPGAVQALRAFGDIRSIAADASSRCGVTIQIPG